MSEFTGKKVEKHKRYFMEITRNDTRDGYTCELNHRIVSCRDCVKKFKKQGYKVNMTVIGMGPAPDKCETRGCEVQ